NILPFFLLLVLGSFQDLVHLLLKISSSKDKLECLIFNGRCMLPGYSIKQCPIDIECFFKLLLFIHQAPVLSIVNFTLCPQVVDCVSDFVGAALHNVLSHFPGGVLRPNMEGRRGDCSEYTSAYGALEIELINIKHTLTLLCAFISKQGVVGKLSALLNYVLKDLFSSFRRHVLESSGNALNKLPGSFLEPFLHAGPGDLSGHFSHDVTRDHLYAATGQEPVKVLSCEMLNRSSDKTNKTAVQESITPR